MSASTVTIEELESERAELLPNRETLCSGGCYHPGNSLSQVGYSNNAQSGFINVNLGNGDFNNWFSAGSGNIW
jgi:hypothetical protein